MVSLLRGTVYVFFVHCVQKVLSEVRPVWFVFSGMGTQWQYMGRDLMILDCFRESIMQSDAALRPYGVQLYDLIIHPQDDTFANVVNSFVGIVAIQVDRYLSDSVFGAFQSHFIGYL